MSAALDFYAYWNGSQVADVLQAVVGIVGTDGYRTGMSFLALAGFLTVMTVAAVRCRGGTSFGGLRRPSSFSSWCSSPR